MVREPWRKPRSVAKWWAYIRCQSIPSPAIHADERLHEADHPTSLVARFGADQPLSLDCGINLSPFQIAYQTYGELNADRSNAILICHALTWISMSPIGIR